MAPEITNPRRRIARFRRFVDNVSATNAMNLGLRKLPEIQIKPADSFDSPTMRACASSDGKVILASDRLIDLPAADTVFAVSHEFRHIWQRTFAPDMLVDYKPRDQFDDTVTYNLQPAEIDANAWGCIVCDDLLHLRPLLEDSLGPVVWEAIRKRMGEIAKELRG